MAPLSLGLVRTIHLAHIKQLAQLEIPPLDDMPKEAPPPELFETTIDWITENAGALKYAKDTR